MLPGVLSHKERGRCPCPCFCPVGSVCLSAYYPHFCSHSAGYNRLGQGGFWVGLFNKVASSCCYPCVPCLPETWLPFPPPCCPTFSRSGSYTVRTMVAVSPHSITCSDADGDNMLPCKCPALIQPLCSRSGHIVYMTQEKSFPTATTIGPPMLPLVCAPPRAIQAAQGLCSGLFPKQHLIELRLHQDSHWMSLNLVTLSP